MKTGLIVQADETDRGLDNFSVKRVSVNGEDWVENSNNSTLNVKDATKWIELMREGIMTVILACHDTKIRDSADFFREVLHDFEISFATVCKTSVIPNSPEKLFNIKTNKVCDKFISAHTPKTEKLEDNEWLLKYLELNRKVGTATGFLSGILHYNIPTELKEKIEKLLKELENDK